MNLEEDHILNKNKVQEENRPDKQELSKKSQSENSKTEDKSKNNRIIFALIALLILFVSLIFAVYMIKFRKTVVIGRASSNVSGREVVLENSYLFASPLKAKANGLERVRLTIFVLDSTGSGVPGKKVLIGNALGIDVDAVQSITDDLGKAVYDVSTTKSGYYIIEASVEGKTIPQKVSVNFE